MKAPSRFVAAVFAAGVLVGLVGIVAYQTHQAPSYGQNITLGAQPALSTFQGGTGTSSPSGILYGDGSIGLKTVGIGSGLLFSGGSLSATAVADSGSDVVYVPDTYGPSTCAASTTANTYQNCVEALVKHAADGGASGVTVVTTHDVSASDWTDTLDLNQAGIAINFICTASAQLVYGGPNLTNAIKWNNWNSYGHVRQEFAGCQVVEAATLVHAGDTNTRQTVGLYLGGNTGAVGINVHDNTFNGFGTDIEIGANAYMLDFHSNAISGGNGTTTARGSLVHINAASNSGERNVFDGNTFTDPGNSQAKNAIYITNSGTASNFFTNNSFDDAQIFVGSSNGQTVIDDNHFENAAYATYGRYTVVQGVSSDRSTMITFNGNSIANDTSGANSFDIIIQHGGQLYATGNIINNYGGGTISAFVDHSLDNGVATDHVCQLQVQSGTLTNIISGSGGVAYSRATGATCVTNVDNSYTIGMRAMASNINEFFSGSVTTATFDHSGNWAFTNNGSFGGALTLTPLATAAGAFLAVDPTGKVIATTTPASSGGGATFGKAWELVTGLFGTTVLAPTTTVPFYVTSTATSTVGNLGGVLDATAFAGANIGAQFNAAYAAAPLGGVTIRIPSGTYSFSTTMNASTAGKGVILDCSTGTKLVYTGSGDALDVNFGQSPAANSAINNCYFYGPGTTTAAVAVRLGGSNGVRNFALNNVQIENFGSTTSSGAVTTGDNAYILAFNQVFAHHNGKNFYSGSATNAGENITFNGGTWADCRPFADNCIDFPTASTASVNFEATSIDDASIHIGNIVRSVNISDVHFENPAGDNFPKYTPIVVDSGSNTNIVIKGSRWFNGADTNRPDQFISFAGSGLTIDGFTGEDYGGGTKGITQLVKNTGSGWVNITGTNKQDSAWQQLLVNTGTGRAHLVEAETGYFGIGTSSPTNSFVIATSTALGSSPRIQIDGFGTGAATSSVGIDLTTNSVRDWLLFNLGTDRSFQIRNNASTPVIKLTQAGAFILSTTTAGCASIASTGELYSTGATCGTGSGGSVGNWFTPSTFGVTASNATSTLTGFTAGLYALASSTIGGGTQNSGLTILGGATTTATSTFAGVLIPTDVLQIGSTKLQSFAKLAINQTPTTGGTTTLLISNDNGAVGTGSSGNDAIDIFGSLSGTFGNTNVGGHLSFVRTNTGGSGTTDFLIRSTTGTTMTERLRILGTNGNVGIGTASPGALLTVNGTASTSALTVSGLNAAACDVKADTSGVLSCGTDATGAGTGAFPFTPLSWGNSTSTVIGFTQGFVTNASSTIAGNLQIASSSLSTFIAPFYTKTFSYASSTQGMGTTTRSIGVAPAGMTVKSVQCDFSNFMRVLLYHGSGTLSNDLVASSTIGTVAYTSNTFFNSGEAIRVDIGTTTNLGTNVYGSCTIKYVLN